MLEEIMNLIEEYGIETVILALSINLFTFLIKLPIKKYAQKAEDSTKITRFIVFLPFVIGCLLTFLYVGLINRSYSIDKQYVTLWLTSSSLSLTFYAVFEKMVPKRHIQDETVNDSSLKTGVKRKKIYRIAEEKILPTQINQKSKIILRGRNNEKIKNEEESI